MLAASTFRALANVHLYDAATRRESEKLNCVRSPRGRRCPGEAQVKCIYGFFCRMPAADIEKTLAILGWCVFIIATL